MTSDSGTLYIGMTNNLEKRVLIHKKRLVEGFSKKYGCEKLVYYEYFTDVLQCIGREKQLKNWRRKKKEELIRSMNSGWKDLSKAWF